jgi:hypothetical protein
MKIFCQNLKLTQLLRKFKITETNGYNMFGEWTETDCHNYEISTTWETKPWTTPQKTSRLLMGPNWSRILKVCKLYEDDLTLQNLHFSVC